MPVASRADSAVPSRARLGNFELNLRTGELQAYGQCDDNSSVLLREQPFLILKMLIDRGGKIVTREELRKKLWPNDTIVNFDHSINVAIGILRRALGDSAEHPEYIETIARRGYRLISPVKLLLTKAAFPFGEETVKPEPSGVGTMVGKRVSHYRVLDVIGGGGMGMVYRAEDLRLGRRVAVKFLPPEVANDPAVLRRFEREAQTASALNHPNICTVYEIEEHDGQPFIVMELLQGVSLSHELESFPSKVIPISRLLEIALQVCDGLQAAHEKGIIHRDIKPANIFLTDQGPAKVLDFGLAKLVTDEWHHDAEPLQYPESRNTVGVHGAELPSTVQAALTLTGPAMGTIAYMSPEQVRRERLDVTTDLFSFGLVLHEAATGCRAFPGQTATVVHSAILSESPVPAYQLNSAVPKKLSAVISKALEKDPARRFQSAAEMRHALSQIRLETGSTSITRRTAWLAASAIVVVVLLATWLYRRSIPTIKLSRGDTVVLAVANQTEDPVFDDALYTGAYFDLQQTPYVHLLDLDKLGEALWELHLPADTKPSPQIGRQVCLRTRSRMVIATSIGEAGNGFRIEMQGIDCQSGKTVARVDEEVPNRAQVIHSLGIATAELRAKLGEPPSSIAQFNRPLDEETSPSPEALQLLTEGYKNILALHYPEGILDFQRAIALDSQMAVAYAALASAEASLGDHPVTIQYATKAFALRDRASLPVRFQIEDIYYDNVTGEQEKAYSVLSQWVQLFPDDFIGHNNFARCLLLLGQQDHSLAEAREAARLLPNAWSYFEVIFRSILTGRLDEATAEFKEADARKFDNSRLRYDRVLLAFLQKDSANMEQQWRWAVGKQQADHLMLNGEGLVDAYYGHYRDYARLSGQAANLAREEGALTDATSYAEDMALQEAEVGNMAEARHLEQQALAGSQSARTVTTAALALARAGDIAKANRLVDQITREAPLDTLVQNYTLPTIRAAIRLQIHDPAGAIKILRPTAKFDMAYPPSFNSLYPAYIRGLAYLQMGQAHLASVEFQKLLDHPGIVGRNVIGALSYLQMARAQKLQGNVNASLKSYQDFLDLWKKADPDLPVYREAQVEYGKLRHS